MRTLLFAGLPALLLMATTGAHEPHRHHGAHVHGESSGSLAQDGTQLTLSVVIPGVNLVGFEHPPRDQGQQARLESAIAILESGDWLVFDERGACRIEALSVRAAGFSQADQHHDHHDHSGGHAHAEFLVEALIECDRMARLGWLEVDLFEQWPGNETIVLDVLTDQRTERARLAPDRMRVSLRAAR